MGPASSTEVDAGTWSANSDVVTVAADSVVKVQVWSARDCPSAVAMPVAVAVRTVEAGSRVDGVKGRVLPSEERAVLPLIACEPFRSDTLADAVTGFEKVMDGLTVRATPAEPGAGLRCATVSVGL